MGRKRCGLGKGEIAHYEQFLLFPQCFQKACFPGASKGVIVWEWVKRVVKSRDCVVKTQLSKWELKQQGTIIIKLFATVMPLFGIRNLVKIKCL